jgi:hypothetical protein
MQVKAKFVKNDRHTHLQFGVVIHSDRQKKWVNKGEDGETDNHGDEISPHEITQ